MLEISDKLRRTNFVIFSLIAPLLFHEAVATQPERADVVIVHAKVFSPGDVGEQSQSPDQFAEAIAMRGSKIVAVGTDAEIEKLVGEKTLRIDANGASVTPGFNDAHVHMFSGSESLQQIDLLDATDLNDIGQRIHSFATANPTKQVIVGRGWLYGFFPGGLPTREQLDAVIVDRPAVMKCYDGHSLWLNSKALAIAGITRDSVDPENGIIVRDAQGEPTGVLKEAAMRLAEPVMPKLTIAERADALRVAIREAHRLGVTSVQEAGIGLAELEVLESLRKSGDLKLRVYIALEGRPRMTEAEIDQLVSLRANFKELNIGAVKLYADGVIEAHTAALLQPYANKPILGLPEYTRDDLNRVIELLDKRGFQIMVHAIGDGGIRMTLDSLERAAKLNPTWAKGRRHRLEHIESVSREDIPRFGKLGVIASMQPYHANPNSNIFNVWAVNLGPERASRAWSWKSIQDAGGKLAFGTDWPVVGLDPLPGLHTAMTRQTLDGEPRGGFVPAQRLPLSDSLRAYTCGAAYAEYSETSKGRLEPGMLADVIIWDRDLFSVPVDQVKDASVVRTIYDGQVVFE